MKFVLSLVVLLACAASALGQDFHIVASRRTVIRETPSLQARDLARLEAGEALNCFTDAATGQAEQRDRFYRVRLPDEREAWALTSMVRVFPGKAPGRPHIPPTGPVVYHGAHVGLPRGFTQLVNDGYIVGYDPRLKIPAWVQYRVTREDIAFERARSNAFRVDERLPVPAQATLTDYGAATSWAIWTALGLDPPAPTNAAAYARGHFAPARDMSRTVDLERESYLLSNMAPQIHNGYNNGVWGALEGRIRRWVNDRGDLTIIAGPVFLPSPRQLDPPATEAERVQAAADAVVYAQPPVSRQVIYNVVGERNVAVPTAFFKVVVDVRDPMNPDVIAFMLPHRAMPGANVANFIVSVREIERVTGLDLLSDLDPAIQDIVETVRAPGLW